MSPHPSQTDNVFCRKLLWPSPLVPDDRFIDEKDETKVIQKALETLGNCNYVDSIENDGLVSKSYRLAWYSVYVEQ